jgi:hypothetical protein
MCGLLMLDLLVLIVLYLQLLGLMVSKFVTQQSNQITNPTVEDVKQLEQENSTSTIHTYISKKWSQNSQRITDLGVLV